MKRTPWFPVLVVFVLSCLALAQLDRIVIPAGTPEDQALQDISKEADAQKKLALYQDFVQKFAGNPAAVAYGNWQISQAYQESGDLAKALEYGDKALAGSTMKRTQSHECPTSSGSARPSRTRNTRNRYRSTPCTRSGQDS